MKFVIVIVLAVTALNEAGREVYNPNIKSRIIAGEEAESGQIPWQVAIQSIKGLKIEFCGGTLIDEEWVLTSAYCISKGDRYVLQFGGLTTDLFEVGRVSMTSNESVIHPSYKEWNRGFDVALVKLPMAINFNERINIIKLPGRFSGIGNDVIATVSGWGRVKNNGAKSRTLRFVNMKSIYSHVCEENYPSQHIIWSTVCLQGVENASPCDGDNGGPLFTTDENGVSTLRGIFSFTHYYGCEAGIPAVFVRAEIVVEWIQSVTGILP